MKNAIIPIAVVAIIAVIIFIVVGGSGLSGRYVPAENGATGGATIFNDSDYIRFDGENVSFQMVGVMDTTFQYKVIDDQILISYGALTYTYSFKKSGNRIFIEGNEWRKE
jgi:hypothetical protein